MSYNEYFDIYESAQKKECKYRAFLIDVVNSKIVFKQNKKRYLKLFKLFDYISLKLLKKGVLINDKQNQLNLALNIANYKEYLKTLITLKNNVFVYDGKDISANLIANPMITGDCACYLTNENTLLDDEFLKILKTGIEKYDVDFDFHFKSAKYETDNYAEGGTKLYKGYVFPILEDVSKKHGVTIKHNELEKK